MEPSPLIFDDWRIDGPDRPRGLYVLGKNGSGKSFFLLDCIAQDMRSGMGLAVLDPHGDLVADVLCRVPPERLDDVIVLDAGLETHAFGLNVFHCPDPGSVASVQKTADTVLQTFKKLFGSSWGYRMEDTLRSVTYTLLANAGTTLADMRPLLTDVRVRSALVANVRDAEVRSYWSSFENMTDRERGELVGPILNKVRPFLVNPLVRRIVTQQSSVDIAGAMDEGKVLLIKLPLPELGEDAVRLLGTAFVGQIMVAAFARSRQELSERRPFALYADECQLFVNDFFTMILTMTRKYGLMPVLAHQFREQLDGLMHRAVMNAGSMVLFSLTGRDSGELAREVQLEAPPEDSLPPFPKSIVQALLDDGHQDDFVQESIDKFLRPLTMDAQRHATPGHLLTTPPPWTSPKRYSYTVEVVKQGIKWIEEYFRGVMRGEYGYFDAPARELLARIAFCLQAHFGIGNEIVQSHLDGSWIRRDFPEDAELRASLREQGEMLEHWKEWGSAKSIELYIDTHQGFLVAGWLGRHVSIASHLREKPIPQYSRHNAWVAPTEPRVMGSSEVSRILSGQPPRHFVAKYQEGGRMRCRMLQTRDVPTGDRAQVARLEQRSLVRHYRTAAELDGQPAPAEAPERRAPMGKRSRNLTDGI